MKLKMALATLGLSLVAVSAFAQSPLVTLTIEPNAPLTAAPGFAVVSGTFEYDFVANPAGPVVYLLPSNNPATGLYNLTNGTGYSAPSAADGGLTPLLDLNLLPIVLGPSLPNNSSFFGPLLQLAYDGTAGTTSGTVFYDLFNTDPFGSNPTDAIATIPGEFRLVPPGTVVPEPGTIALIVGMGVAGLTLRRRRK